MTDHPERLTVADLQARLSAVKIGGPEWALLSWRIRCIEHPEQGPRYAGHAIAPLLEAALARVEAAPQESRAYGPVEADAILGEIFKVYHGPTWEGTVAAHGWARAANLLRKKLNEAASSGAVPGAGERDDGAAFMAFLCGWPHWKHEPDGTAYLTITQLNKARVAYIRECAALARPVPPEAEEGVCGLCGKPMPPGEEMFKYHGYSGPCPNTTGEPEGGTEVARVEVAPVEPEREAPRGMTYPYDDAIGRPGSGWRTGQVSDWWDDARQAMQVIVSSAVWLPGDVRATVERNIKRLDDALRVANRAALAGDPTGEPEA